MQVADSDISQCRYRMWVDEGTREDELRGGGLRMTLGLWVSADLKTSQREILPLSLMASVI